MGKAHAAAPDIWQLFGALACRGTGDSDPVSHSGESVSLIDQGSHLLLIEQVTSMKFSLSIAEALLGRESARLPGRADPVGGC
jgi:hypothetical protein